MWSNRMEETDEQMGEYERTVREHRAFVRAKVAELEASLKMDVEEL